MDTSVIGGCFDDMYQEASLRLFENVRAGLATLLISDITLDELEGAPKQVRDWIKTIPAKHYDSIYLTDQARQLANAYIERGALGRSNRADALHVATATFHKADALASWNFRHMVNARRVRAYNEINRLFGYADIDIGTPEALCHGQVSTADRRF